MLRRIMIMLLVLAAVEGAENVTESESLWTTPSTGEVFLGAAAFGICSGLTLYTPLGIPVVTWMAEHGMLGLVWEPAATFVATHTAQAAVAVGTSMVPATVVAKRVLSSIFTPSSNPVETTKPVVHKPKPNKAIPTREEVKQPTKSTTPSETKTDDKKRVTPPQEVPKEKIKPSVKEQPVKKLINIGVEGVNQPLNLTSITYVPKPQPKPAAVEEPPQVSEPIKKVSGRPKKQPFQNDDWTQFILIGVSFIVVVLWMEGVLTRKTPPVVTRSPPTPVPSPKPVKQSSPDTVYVDDIMKVCQTLGVPGHPWGTPSPAQESPVMFNDPIHNALSQSVVAKLESKIESTDGKINELLNLLKGPYSENTQTNQLETRLQETEGKISRVLDIISAKSRERTSAADTVQKLEKKMEQQGSQMEELLSLVKTTQIDESTKSIPADNTILDQILSKVSTTETRMTDSLEQQNKIIKIIATSEDPAKERTNLILEKISETAAQQTDICNTLSSNEGEVEKLLQFVRQTANESIENNKSEIILSKIANQQLELLQAVQQNTTKPLLDDRIDVLLSQQAEIFQVIQQQKDQPANDDKMDFLLSKVSTCCNQQEQLVNASRQHNELILSKIDRSCENQETVLQITKQQKENIDTKNNTTTSLITNLAETNTKALSKLDNQLQKNQSQTNKVLLDITNTVRKPVHNDNTEINKIIKDHHSEINKLVTAIPVSNSNESVLEKIQSDVAIISRDHRVSDSVEKLQKYVQEIPGLITTNCASKSDLVEISSNQKKNSQNIQNNLTELTQRVQSISNNITQQRDAVISIRDSSHVVNSLVKESASSTASLSSTMGSILQLITSISDGSLAVIENELSEMSAVIQNQNEETSSQFKQVFELCRTQEEHHSPAVSPIMETTSSSNDIYGSDPKFVDIIKSLANHLSDKINSSKSDIILKLNDITLPTLETKPIITSNSDLEDVKNSISMGISGVVKFLDEHIASLITTCNDGTAAQLEQIALLLEQQSNDGNSNWSETVRVLAELSNSVSLQSELSSDENIFEMKKILSNIASSQSVVQDSIKQRTSTTEITEMNESLRRFISSKHQELEQSIQHHESNKMKAITETLKAIHSARDMLLSEEIPDNSQTSSLSLMLKTELDNINNALLDIKTIQSRDQDHYAVAVQTLSKTREPHETKTVDGEIIKNDNPTLSGELNNDITLIKEHIVGGVTLDDLDRRLLDMDDLLLSLQTDKELKQQEGDQLVGALLGIKDLLVSKQTDAEGEPSELRELVTMNNETLLKEIKSLETRVLKSVSQNEKSSSEITTATEKMTNAADELQQNLLVPKSLNEVVSSLSKVSSELQSASILKEMKDVMGKWQGELVVMIQSLLLDDMVPQLQTVDRSVKDEIIAKQDKVLTSLTSLIIQTQSESTEESINEITIKSAISEAMLSATSGLEETILMALKINKTSIGNDQIELLSEKVSESVTLATSGLEQTILMGLKSMSQTTNEVNLSKESLQGIEQSITSSSDSTREQLQTISRNTSNLEQTISNTMKTLSNQSAVGVEVPINSEVRSKIDNISSLVTSLIISKEESTHALTQATEAGSLNNVVVKDILTKLEEVQAVQKKTEESYESHMGQIQPTLVKTGALLEKTTAVVEKASEGDATVTNQLTEFSNELGGISSLLSNKESTTVSEQMENIVKQLTDSSEKQQQHLLGKLGHLKKLLTESITTSELCCHETNTVAQLLGKDDEDSGRPEMTFCMKINKILETTSTTTELDMVKFDDLLKVYQNTILKEVTSKIDQVTESGGLPSKQLTNLIEESSKSITTTISSQLSEQSPANPNQLKQLLSVVTTKVDELGNQLKELINEKPGDELSTKLEELTNLLTEAAKTDITSKVEELGTQIKALGDEKTEDGELSTKLEVITNLLTEAAKTDITSKVEELGTQIKALGDEKTEDGELSTKLEVITNLLTEAAKTDITSKVEELGTQIKALGDEKTEDGELSTKLEVITNLLTEAAKTDITSKVEELGTQIKALGDEKTEDGELSTKLEVITNLLTEAAKTDITSKVEELGTQIKALGDEKTEDGELSSKLEVITNLLTEAAKTDITSKVEELGTQIKALGDEKTEDGELSTKLEVITNLLTEAAKTDITSKVEELGTQIKALGDEKTEDGELSTKLEVITNLLTEAAKTDITSKVEELGTQIKALGDEKTEDGELSTKLEVITNLLTEAAKTDITSKVEELGTQIKALGDEKTEDGELSTKLEVITNLLTEAAKTDITSKVEELGTQIKALGDEKTEDGELSSKLEVITNLLTEAAKTDITSKVEELGTQIKALGDEKTEDGELSTKLEVITNLLTEAAKTDITSKVEELGTQIKALGDEKTEDGELSTKLEVITNLLTEAAKTDITSKVEELGTQIKALGDEKTEDGELSTKLEVITNLLTEAAKTDITSKVEELGTQIKALGDEKTEDGELSTKLEVITNLLTEAAKTDITSKVEELGTQIKALGDEKTEDGELSTKLEVITNLLTEAAKTNVSSKVEDLSCQIKILNDENIDTKLSTQLEEITDLLTDSTKEEISSSLKEINELLVTVADSDVNLKVEEIKNLIRDSNEKTEIATKTDIEHLTKQLEHSATNGSNITTNDVIVKLEGIETRITDLSQPEQSAVVTKKMDVITQLLTTILQSNKTTPEQDEMKLKLQNINTLLEEIGVSVSTFRDQNEPITSALDDIKKLVSNSELPEEVTTKVSNAVETLLKDEGALIPTKLEDIKKLISSSELPEEVTTKVSDALLSEDAVIPSKLEEIKKLVTQNEQPADQVDKSRDIQEIIVLKNEETTRIMKALSTVKDSLIEKQQEIVELVGGSQQEDSQIDFRLELSAKQQQMLDTIGSLEHLVTSKQSEMETFIKKTIEKDSLTKREDLQTALRNFEHPTRVSRQPMGDGLGDCITSDGESVCTTVFDPISPREPSPQADFLTRLGKRIDGTMHNAVQLIERQRLIGKHVLYNQKMLVFRYYWKLIEFYRIKFSVKNDIRIEAESLKFAELCDSRRLVVRHWSVWRTQLNVARKEKAGGVTEPRVQKDRLEVIEREERLKSLSPLKLFSQPSPVLDDDEYCPVPIFNSPLLGDGYVDEKSGKRKSEKISKRPPPKFSFRKSREQKSDHQTPTQKIPAEEKYVEKIFKLIDSNEDGRIDSTDFRRALDQHREVKKLFQIPEATGGPNCHLCARVWQILTTDGVSESGGQVTWNSFANYFDFLSSPSCTSKTFEGRKTRHRQRHNSTIRKSPPPQASTRIRSNSYTSPSCKTLEFS